jgi:hypothetical protein
LQFGTWTDPSLQQHYQFCPTTLDLSALPHKFDIRIYIIVWVWQWNLVMELCGWQNYICFYEISLHWNIKNFIIMTVMNT